MADDAQSPESNHDDLDGGSGGGEGGNSSVREQDRFLPVANISRIMKKALPQNAKIAKDAKETVQECVSEFISFITSEASDKCQREKRKTINGDDLLWAMSTLGFEDYVDPLKVYLHKYRETEGEKASMAKQGGETSGRKDSVVGMSAMGPSGQMPGQGNYGGPPPSMQYMPGQMGGQHNQQW
eukprot:TRINITY_DN4378_c0_g1_i3.p1 TRINITY_DN4378_c0_g1~~TRINITY_DN4378_c0_g1_i3.p1  ORF type:complete len:183 (-),score=32.80 TRINITY_DN4378_c0_g1_i3:253-801(-)